MPLLFLFLLCSWGTQLTSASMMSCETARHKCAFASACTKALQTYFARCDEFLKNDPTKCPDSCLFALVALTSTHDGKRMLDCDCQDKFCESMKARVEVCRPMVIEAAKNDTVMPCEMAQWVCQVDPECSLAYGYYHTYCKRLMHGVACTERCMNSMLILQRQEKALRMNRCRCSGRTAGECLRNKEHMVRLCYGGGPPDDESGDHPRRRGGGKKNRKKHIPASFEQDPDRAQVEMMLANSGYRPDVRHRYNATTADGTGSAASAVRAPSYTAVLCAALAATILVTRSSSRPSTRFCC